MNQHDEIMNELSKINDKIDRLLTPKTPENDQKQATFMRFLKAVEPDEYINQTITDAYLMYCASTRTTFKESDIMSRNMFGRFMKKHGYISVNKTIDGHSERIYIALETENIDGSN